MPRLDLARDELADVLHRRQIFVVVLQRVEGVRVGGHDALRARSFDGVGVVIAQRHEQRLFAEAAHVVTAVFFRCAQDREVFASLG